MSCSPSVFVVASSKGHRFSLDDFEITCSSAEWCMARVCFTIMFCHQVTSQSLVPLKLLQVSNYAEDVDTLPAGQSHTQYVGAKQQNIACGPSTETVGTLSVQLVGKRCMSAPEC